MKFATEQYHGSAGPEFLKQLTEPGNLSETRANIRADLAEIITQFGLPEKHAPEVGRVAHRFALIAYAGELASPFGVTGWQAGEAFMATRRCFQDWLADSGAAEGNDRKVLLGQVSAFLQAHGSSRFAPQDAESEALTRYPSRAGFRYADGGGAAQYWVLSEPFKNELCRGQNIKAGVLALRDAGWLLDGDSEMRNGKQVCRSTQKKRITSIGVVNVYVLCDAALGRQP